MWRRWFAVVALVLVGVIGGALSPARAAPAAGAGDDVTIYFFWGDGCPHCAEAEPVLAGLADEYGLTITDFELWYHPENQEPFLAMAEKFGFEPSGVPTIFLGDRHWVGWTGSIQRELEATVAACIADGCPDAGAGVITPAEPTAEPDPTPSPGEEPGEEPGDGPGDGVITLPIFGEVDASQQSLALTTALIALVDGFNPCSLWVLSVLLALTLRTGSRGRVALIGLTFIFVTALVYALFIAGMFSVLTVVNIAPWVRVVVALVALVFAAVNIKDYFWFKEGVSFTIPESKKPGIYSRIRAVSRTESLPAILGGTIVLAAGVSVVELACTAGFPVLWTNILTAQEVGTLTFVALLLLYMLIYQLDELAIFGVAVVTLRASKLEEKHGRILKLVGGMLMLTLAVVMIVDPSLMSSVGTALLIFGLAVAATLLVLLVHRVVLPRFGIQIGSEKPAAKQPTAKQPTAKHPATGSEPKPKPNPKSKSRR